MDTKAKIITFSSGKGGVGKTCTAVNLSILLAQQGFRVCLVDADSNLAKVNIMLKLAPEFTLELEQVLSGKKSLNDIILHKAGINIIPGSSDLMAPAQNKYMLATKLELKSNYDYLIINNSAGITENVISYVKVSDSANIVITPEPSSLTDAFALVRALQKRGNTKKLNIIVNNVASESYAKKIYQRFSASVVKRIGCELKYLGWIVSDDLIPKSISEQNPIVLQHPASHAALNLKDLSRELVSQLKQQSSARVITSNNADSHIYQADFSTPAKTTPLEMAEPVQPVQALSLSNAQLKTETPEPVKPVETLSLSNAQLKTELLQRFNAETAQLQMPEPVKPVQTLSLSDAQLKAELLQRINNEAYESSELKDILESINNAYLTRFGDYAVNLSGIIADAVNMDRISKNTMKHMILMLQGLYQDQYGSAQDIIAEATESETKQNILSQESIDQRVQLMQQLLDSDSNTEDTPDDQDKGPKLVASTDKSDVDLTKQELADSIRYASLTGNIKK